MGKEKMMKSAINMFIDKDGISKMSLQKKMENVTLKTEQIIY